MRRALRSRGRAIVVVSYCAKLLSDRSGTGTMFFRVCEAKDSSAILSQARRTPPRIHRVPGPRVRVALPRRSRRPSTIQARLAKPRIALSRSVRFPRSVVAARPGQSGSRKRGANRPAGPSRAATNSDDTPYLTALLTPEAASSSFRHRQGILQSLRAAAEPRRNQCRRGTCAGSSGSAAPPASSPPPAGSPTAPLTHTPRPR